MDLHPLIVHFPIALLTVYTALEVFKRFTKAAYWMQVRAVLVIVGAVGALVSLSTGEQAEHLFEEKELLPVLEMHSLLASIVTWAYMILAVSYLIVWLEHTSAIRSLSSIAQKSTAFFVSLSSRILTTPIAPILAVCGFLGLAVVGALGAILVYGPDFDPITSLVYTLLFRR